MPVTPAPCLITCNVGTISPATASVAVTLQFYMPPVAVQISGDAILDGRVASIVVPSDSQSAEIGILPGYYVVEGSGKGVQIGPFWIEVKPDTPAALLSELVLNVVPTEHSHSTLIQDIVAMRNAAAASAVSAAGSAARIDLGALDAAVGATVADRVQTGLDRTATAADAVATAADRVQTGLDRTATVADRVQTGLDRTATAADAVATAADRVQTGLDRTATGADRTATAADRVQTGLDRTATGADRTATAADRVQTGLDRTATALSAAQAALYDGPRQITVQQLLLDTALTYTGGSPSTVAPGDSVRVDLGGFAYRVAASGATDHHVITAGGVKLYVLAGAGGRARIEAFGCTLNGTTDDTAAFQRAMDSGLRLCSGKGTLRLTETILLDPGADFEGAGGVASYANAALKIRFEPVSKRGVFVWRTAPVGYVFSGVRLTGFCVRGFGAGISVVLDLPLLYNGYLDFFAYAGLDTWLRLRQWMDTDVRGGCQGFSAFAVEFYGSGVNPSDVTTSTTIDAYISQGPTAYIATGKAVTDCKIFGVIESVDKACDIARGNIIWADVYTENVPRTDAGAAWVYGKTGSAPAYQTALHLNLRPGIGYTGGAIANATLLDVGAVRYVRLSGYTYLYAKLLTTTAETRAVSIVGLDTDNIAAFSSASGVADYGVISTFGFNPRSMEKTPGVGYFLDGSAITPHLELWPRTRQTVTKGQMFVDADFSNKLRMRDDFGNFSDPILRLAVSGNSGWTIQGGRLTPGETLRNSLASLGEVALWQSMRHSRDTAQTVAACSTASGSAIVTKSVGAFNSIDVGDWVTASAGFPSASTQYRVIAKASDGSTITLNTNASSTVAGTVTVATEAHQLVPLAQQGFRSYGADPVGVLVPKFLGEDVFRSDNSTWYRSTGLTSANWKLMT